MYHVAPTRRRVNSWAFPATGVAGNRGADFGQRRDWADEPIEVVFLKEAYDDR
jgi:hypothetical protein